MATERRQFIGYSTESANQNFLGMPREMTVDLAKKTLVMHDGYKKGGYPMAREDLANVPSEAKESLVAGLEKLANKTDSASQIDSDHYPSTLGAQAIANEVADAAVADITSSLVERFSVSVLQTAWQATGGSELYPAIAEVQVASASSSLDKMPIVAFGENQAISGQYSPSADWVGSTKTLKIYAKEVPSEDITISLALI